MRTYSEKLLKYLIKHKDINMKISFSFDSYKNTKLSKEEFIYALNELQKLGYIKYNFKSIHKNDLSYGVGIELESPAITYYDDKIRIWFENKYDFIKFIIPTLIALAALLISIFK